MQLRRVHQLRHRARGGADRIAAVLFGPLVARRVVVSSARVVTAPPFALNALLRRLAVDNMSVIDVGTGMMQSLARSPCPVKIGLDAHRPYLEHRTVQDAIPIHASALDLTQLFVPGAVHLVTLIDFIEHLETADAEEMLRQAESVAGRRVVLLTPRGEFPQAGFDAFGLGGEEFQRHRSTWDVDDFVRLGYNVIILRRFHDDRNQSFVEAFGAGASPVDALLAWKAVG